ncbi:MULTISPECIES: MarR family transcriptional regulator [unclassified Amycolatopsis]|uniref:MarR family winged helix-turn-helix transcriptional regulator n=1 Tax=unclassified Amycolatopsis TaxID=2618356 RepID=UPI0028756C8D|nr:MULTISPECIES: MarR family transcriptional regulator [unclassified Amycolatopsis]MDS0140489.1 winged helix DNA-binding protein [Amycolatopsis sp. 505]MDS0149494.1 winged helix DNA-binding protein [Amycolatopsis sp. CM201R]
MVVHPTAEGLDLSLTALFAGWATTDEVQRRLATRGFGDLRFNDGVVIQHVLAAPLSITALAERMGVTQQAASKAVADLERRGLLRRDPDPADARTKLLHLTEHALAAVEATRVLRRELQEEIEAAYGAKQVEEAQKLLAAVIGRYGGGDAIRARRVRPPR